MKHLLAVILLLTASPALAASFPLEALPRYRVLYDRLVNAGWDPLKKAGAPSEVECYQAEGYCIARWISPQNEIIKIFLHDDPAGDSFYVLIRWQG